MNISDGIHITSAAWQTCPNGHGFGPVIRDHYLLHYIISGKGIYEVDGTTYHLSAGQAFLAYPGLRSYYRADEEDPWTYQWVGFYGHEADVLIERCGFSRGKDLIFSLDCKENALQLLKQIEANFSKPDENSRIAAVGYLYQFLSLIAKPQQHKGYAEKLIQYIQLHYYYQITVTDMAAYVGLNRSYLSKIFKEYTGSSPQEYLLDFRIGRAKVMLRETSLPIFEVAYSCGFVNLPYFTTQFKKRTGVSPKVYRAQGEE